jgi:F-type H+-transporting ATPase subunit a
VSSDDQATIPAERPRSNRRPILLALVAVIVIDVLAVLFVPPTPPAHPDDPFTYPNDGMIGANVELPAPHVVWDLAPDQHSEGLLQFHPSITSSILTSWIIIALLLVGAFLLARRRDEVPGRAQNVVEFIYEALNNFATSLGGPKATRYVPLFAGLFVYILASNWSGLIPFVGKIYEFRAPSSDVNITIGLALVSFVIFHVEGVRALGFRGYLSKFFPVGEFKGGFGAGLLAMFVGLVELLLEFVKPLTLSMRLFGNIFGGEVALGVITALTIAVIPVALVSLEFLLNFVQALIFSTLTLMFTLAAIEGHHEEHEGPGHEFEPIATPMGDIDADPSPSPAH